jgi:hypothetical protein
MQKIKGLCTGFLLFLIVWNLMNAGLAFSQMALLDVGFRGLLSLVYAAVVFAIWED